MKDITVILLTYNSSLKRTLLSLKSVIYQKDINVEIVISDDCSKNNNFKEIELFFKENNFNDYVLISHDKNVGTVNNYLSAINEVKTEYFKDLGQGDMFCDEHSLKRMFDCCNTNKPSLLFTDAVYYDLENNILNVFEHDVCPQNEDVYKKGDKDLIKRNQLAYDDIILGSTFIYKTDVAKKYFNILKNKVKYAEDNSVRLMALYKEKIDYLPINGILYEFGSGISTSKNTEFERLLDLDWENTNDIILNECKQHQDKYSKQIIAHIEYEREKSHSIIDKIKYYIVNEGFLRYRLLLENRPKKTSIIYDKDFIEKCMNND